MQRGCHGLRLSHLRRIHVHLPQKGALHEMRAYDSRGVPRRVHQDVVQVPHLQQGRLDKHLEGQPMPPEYQNTRVVILCNDCEAKTSTKYHWGGLKCEVCLSYNTVELQILNCPTTAAGFSGPEMENSREPAQPDASAAAAPSAQSPRDATLPRPPTHRPGTSRSSRQGVEEDSPVSAPDRPARSVSPVPVPVPAGQIPAADESDREEDMFGFWGREERRSPTLMGDAGKAVSEGEEEEDEEGEEDDEGGDISSDVCDEADEDEDDEEEIALFGHR